MWPFFFRAQSRSQSPRAFWSAPRHGAQFPETKILGLPASRHMHGFVYVVSRDKVDADMFRESTKHGPLVHGPPPWTGSMDRVHENMDRVHGPLTWTGSMDPLFLLPLLIRSKKKIK